MDWLKILTGLGIVLVVGAGLGALAGLAAAMVGTSTVLFVIALVVLVVVIAGLVGARAGGWLSTPYW